MMIMPLGVKAARIPCTTKNYSKLKSLTYDVKLSYELTKNEENYYLAILNRCANRDSTPQFYDKLPGVDEQYFNGREELSNQDFLGLVLDYKDSFIRLRHWHRTTISRLPGCLTQELL